VQLACVLIQFLEHTLHAARDAAKPDGIHEAVGAGLSMLATWTEHARGHVATAQQNSARGSRPSRHIAAISKLVLRCRRLVRGLGAGAGDFEKNKKSADEKLCGSVSATDSESAKPIYYFLAP
jgi:hypothetical protein